MKEKIFKYFFHHRILGGENIFKYNFSPQKYGGENKFKFIFSQQNMAVKKIFKYFLFHTWSIVLIQSIPEKIEIEETGEMSTKYASES